MKRTIALLALALGCVPAPIDRTTIDTIILEEQLDAGTSSDAGDAGPLFTCDAGADFCWHGSFWACDLEGTDASLVQNCVPAIELGQPEQGGCCVEAPFYQGCVILVDAGVPEPLDLPDGGVAPQASCAP